MSLTENRSKALWMKVLRKLQYSAFRQRWNIAATPYPASMVAGLEGPAHQAIALQNLRWMEEDREAFAADPFIVKNQNEINSYRIFYEAFPWKETRGRIDYVNFRAGMFDSPKTSLSSPHHLSYPYIMPYEGDIAIMPEHSSAGDVSAYRLREDGVAGKEWSLGLGVRLIDSSITFQNGRYWLFATKPGENENSDLYIYHSSSLSGGWKAHSRNPVKTDCSNSRPAGQFIFFGRKLYRPAQDCMSHYGSSIKINEITTLTADKFGERVVSEIHPLAKSTYNYGLHTISYAGNLTAIDGARIESSIHPIFDPLGRRILRSIEEIKLQR